MFTVVLCAIAALASTSGEEQERLLNAFSADLPDECAPDNCKICNDADSCHTCEDGFLWKWRGTLCEKITTTTTTTTGTTALGAEEEGLPDNTNVFVASGGGNKESSDSSSSAKNMVYSLLAFIAVCAI